MKRFFYNKINHVVSKATLIDPNTKIQCLKYVLARYSEIQDKNRRPTIVTNLIKDTDAKYSAKKLIFDLNQIEILYAFLLPTALFVCFILLSSFFYLTSNWIMVSFVICWSLVGISVYSYNNALKELLNRSDKELLISSMKKAANLYLKK